MQNKSYGQTPMGSTVSSLPVEKFKASKSRKSLITLLHRDPIFTKSHFHESLGAFLHNEVVEQLGWKPKIKYNWLIVEWDCDQAGTKIVSNNYEFKVLSIGEYNGYTELKNKYNIKGDFSKKYVVQVSCDNEQYQNMHFEITNIKAPYLSNKQMSDEIKKQKDYLIHFVPNVVGREVSPEETREKLGVGNFDQNMQAPSGPGIGQGQMNELDFEEAQLAEGDDQSGKQLGSGNPVETQTGSQGNEDQSQSKGDEQGEGGQQSNQGKDDFEDWGDEEDNLPF